MLWHLHYRLLRAQLDFSRPAAWAGLACGSVVVLALVASSGGALVFRISFFGWPVLAAIYYAVVLWRLPMRAAGEQRRMNDCQRHG